MRHDYPILLDVSSRRCVIVGGGAVAARKAQGLLDSGACRVVVVSPELKESFAGITHIPELYKPAHLDGAGLAFAATDSSAVNDAVVRDAKARGILVTRADGDDECAGDFVVPARLREGPVTVCVSAGSAALAVLIRDAIHKRWDVGWSKLAEVMQTLRPELKQGEPEPSRRREIFRRLASQEAVDVLATGGVDALREWMRK